MEGKLDLRLSAFVSYCTTIFGVSRSKACLLVPVELGSNIPDSSRITRMKHFDYIAFLSLSLVFSWQIIHVPRCLE